MATTRVVLPPELAQAFLEHMRRQHGGVAGPAIAAQATGLRPGEHPDGEGGARMVSVAMDGLDDDPSTEPRGHTHSHLHNGPTPPEPVPVARLMSLLQTNGIFLVILIVRLLADHMLGVLLFVGLVGCSWHADNILVSQIALRESKRCGIATLKYLWVMMFCCLDIACLYYFFAEQNLYRSLYFMLPTLETYGLADLIWMVMLTDYVVRFATITLKALLSLIPHGVLPYKRRGKYYGLIEELSQFYRLLLPVHPWMAFLFTSDSHGWLSVLLIIAYFIAKFEGKVGIHDALLQKGSERALRFIRLRLLGEIWTFCILLLIQWVYSFWAKSSELWVTIKRAMITVNFGIRALSQDTEIAGNVCPICHDSFNEPVMLNCKHVFCEDCVAMWLDRESTCPMCRAIVGDKPTWRNGATTNVIQWY